MPLSHKRQHDRGQQATAFTLVELVLVMAVLAVVLALAVPVLSRFFQGRKVEEEALRFLALTHYAQSRAVHEGVPMLLWIDTEAGRYGLEAEWSYAGTDPRAVGYEVDPSIRIEVESAAVSRTASEEAAVAWAELFRGMEGLTRPGRYTIRFTPDGSPGPLSPERIRFIQETESTETVAVLKRARHRRGFEWERYEVPRSPR